MEIKTFRDMASIEPLLSLCLLWQEDSPHVEKYHCLLTESLSSLSESE